MQINWEKFQVADYRYRNYITTEGQEEILKYYEELVSAIEALTYALPGVDMLAIVDGSYCDIRFFGQVAKADGDEDRIYEVDKVEIFPTGGYRRMLSIINTKLPSRGRRSN